MGSTDKDDTSYSQEETEARASAALKRMLSTPHKAQKDSKKGRAR